MCILEASVSTRLRMGESLPTHHDQDHIAGKGDSLLQHYNLVQNFILMLQAMKFLQQKQRWKRNGKIGDKDRRGT